MEQEKENIIQQLEDFMSLKLKMFAEEEIITQEIYTELRKKLPTLSMNELLAFYNSITEQKNSSQTDILNLFRTKGTKLQILEQRMIDKQKEYVITDPKQRAMIAELKELGKEMEAEATKNMTDEEKIARKIANLEESLSYYPDCE